MNRFTTCILRLRESSQICLTSGFRLIQDYHLVGAFIVIADERHAARHLGLCAHRVHIDCVVDVNVVLVSDKCVASRGRVKVHELMRNGG